VNTTEKIHNAIFSSDSLEEMEILINEIVSDEQAMDKKPQHHCLMRHTIPLEGYCDLKNCGDYFPSNGNVCTNLRYAEPSPKKYPAMCILFGGDKGKCRTECKKCWKDTQPKSTISSRNIKHKVAGSYMTVQKGLVKPVAVNG